MGVGGTEKVRAINVPLESKVFHKFWPSGTALDAAIILACLAILAATARNVISDGLLDVFFSYNQDHQLKSSQPDFNLHSAGDSDV